MNFFKIVLLIGTLVGMLGAKSCPGVEQAGITETQVIDLGNRLKSESKNPLEYAEKISKIAKIADKLNAIAPNGSNRDEVVKEINQDIEVLAEDSPVISDNKTQIIQVVKNVADSAVADSSLSVGQQSTKQSVSVGELPATQPIQNGIEVEVISPSIEPNDSKQVEMGGLDPSAVTTITTDEILPNYSYDGVLLLLNPEVQHHLEDEEEISSMSMSLEESIKQSQLVLAELKSPKLEKPPYNNFSQQEEQLTAEEKLSTAVARAQEALNGAKSSIAVVSNVRSRITENSTRDEAKSALKEINEAKSSFNIAKEKVYVAYRDTVIKDDDDDDENENVPNKVTYKIYRDVNDMETELRKINVENIEDIIGETPKAKLKALLKEAQGLLTKATTADGRIYEDGNLSLNPEPMELALKEIQEVESELKQVDSKKNAAYEESSLNRTYHLKAHDAVHDLVSQIVAIVEQIKKLSKELKRNINTLTIMGSKMKRGER